MRRQGEIELRKHKVKASQSGNVLEDSLSRAGPSAPEPPQKTPHNPVTLSDYEHQTDNRRADPFPLWNQDTRTFMTSVDVRTETRPLPQVQPTGTVAYFTGDYGPLNQPASPAGDRSSPEAAPGS